MGTRSMTIVMDDNQELVRIYRQMDGYPEGHGVDLAKLCDVKMVNGLGPRAAGSSEAREDTARAHATKGQCHDRRGFQASSTPCWPIGLRGSSLSGDVAAALPEDCRRTVPGR